MSLKRRAGLSILLLGLVSAVGCTAPVNRDAYIAHQVASKAVNTLAPETGQRLTGHQLEALIGKPERILSLQEFESILDGTDPALAKLFRDSVRDGDSGRGEPPACSLWLYAWKDPLEVQFDEVGGIAVKHITERLSFAYAVRDSRTVFAHEIRR
jgi:hypothetical protein